MKAVPWCLSWILFEIALTAGSQLAVGNQARLLCCEVGKQRALTSRNCDIDALGPLNHPDVSDHVCKGFMRQCCRKALKEKECEAGKDYALSDQDCEDLISPSSQECCATCKTARSSPTCVAEWLNGDDLLLPVFLDCCQPQPPQNLTTEEVFPKRPKPQACGAGYTLSQHIHECIDLDECAAGTHNCKGTEACENREGSFKCKRFTSSRCGVGYVFRIGVGCVDEDECTSAHACSGGEICVNRGGHYMCVPPCKEGFQIDQTSVECVDVDECATKAHNCKDTQECVNTEGSFECRESNLVESCKEGYQRSATGDCKDIDECAMNTHNCAESQQCVNSEGGFLCKERCEEGFALNSAGRCEDIDECATIFPCDKSTQVCKNTRGGFTCECKSGFERREPNLAVCSDIDECKRSLKPCGEQATCVNTVGSFSCFANCGDGYNHVNGTCIDRNECAEMYPSACPPGSLCENTVGSFKCIPKIVHCKEGMRRSLDGTKCENIDECSEDLHDCDLSTEVCLDRVGSFDCVCKEGFKRDFSGKCVPVSRCGVGFRQASIGGACQDINECDNPGVCEQECRNTPGSYLCKCKEGFKPDKHNKAKCVDIDECSVPGHCPGLCENTHGSFKCTCPEGYEMKRNSCFDVNECANPLSNNCRGSERCLNIGGGFRCLTHACPTNYTRDNFNAMRCLRDQACEGQAHCALDPDLIIFNHIPSNRSNARRPLSVRISGETDVFADFSLHVTKVIPHKVGLKEATDDNVELKARRTTAKIIVREPIVGPQDVHMTLKAKLYKFREGSTVADEIFKIVEWRVVLYVPAYDL